MKIPIHQAYNTSVFEAIRRMATRPVLSDNLTDLIVLDEVVEVDLPIDLFSGDGEDVRGGYSSAAADSYLVGNFYLYFFIAFFLMVMVTVLLKGWLVYMDS